MERWSLGKEYRQLPVTWLGGNQGTNTLISLFLCSPVFYLCSDSLNPNTSGRKRKAIGAIPEAIGTGWDEEGWREDLDEQIEKNKANKQTDKQ